MVGMAVPPMHPDLVPFAFLLGTWSGAGKGEYPTISSFEYTESITFGHVGKPFLAYSQRTNAADDGRGLHAESGYWRFPRPEWAELIVAHPTGIVEIEEGRFVPSADGGRFYLHTTTLGRSGSAKDVTAVSRVFDIDGDSIDYTVAMAAVGRPIQHHLSATLHRQS
jgi:THAP4-like, heme-binding beta-barrel domain